MALVSTFGAGAAAGAGLVGTAAGAAVAAGTAVGAGAVGLGASVGLAGAAVGDGAAGAQAASNAKAIRPTIRRTARARIRRLPRATGHDSSASWAAHRLWTIVESVLKLSQDIVAALRSDARGADGFGTRSVTGPIGGSLGQAGLCRIGRAELWLEVNVPRPRPARAPGASAGTGAAGRAGRARAATGPPTPAGPPRSGAGRGPAGCPAR
jgi:hypothetical protein